MSVGAVLATLSLLSHIYGAPAPLMECMSWHESRHDVTAVNGDYVGIMQLGSEWWEEFVPQYLADETAPHRYVRTHNDRRDPLAGMIVATWAVAHGYERRWSAYRLCHETGGW